MICPTERKLYLCVNYVFRSYHTILLSSSLLHKLVVLQYLRVHVQGMVASTILRATARKHSKLWETRHCLVATNNFTCLVFYVESCLAL